MLEYLEAIAQFLISIVQFVLNHIKSLIWVVTSIPQFVSSVTAVFAYAPTPLLAFLEISVAIMVLFAIIKLL